MTHHKLMVSYLCKQKYQNMRKLKTILIQENTLTDFFSLNPEKFQSVTFGHEKNDNSMKDNLKILAKEILGSLDCYYWPHLGAYGILIPRLGIGLVPPALKSKALTTGLQG